MAKRPAPSAGGPGSITGQRTKSHMPQLKILGASTKTQNSQINKLKKKKNKMLITDVSQEVRRGMMVQEDSCRHVEP